MVNFNFNWHMQILRTEYKKIRFDETKFELWLKKCIIFYTSRILLLLVKKNIEVNEN